MVSSSCGVQCRRLLTVRSVEDPLRLRMYLEGMAWAHGVWAQGWACRQAWLAPFESSSHVAKAGWHGWDQGVAYVS
jgi:hypothetical protein